MDRELLCQIRSGQFGLASTSFASLLNGIFDDYKHVSKKVGIERSRPRANDRHMRIDCRRLRRHLAQLSDAAECPSSGGVDEHVSDLDKPFSRYVLGLRIVSA